MAARISVLTEPAAVMKDPGLTLGVKWANTPMRSQRHRHTMKSATGLNGRGAGWTGLYQIGSYLCQRGSICGFPAAGSARRLHHLGASMARYARPNLRSVVRHRAAYVRYALVN